MSDCDEKHCSPKEFPILRSDQAGGFCYLDGQAIPFAPTQATREVVARADRNAKFEASAR
jgi:hypothetical protein